MVVKKSKQVKHKKISLETREQIQKLKLMNNAFMNLALENNIPCVEEILRVILDKDDLIVKTVQTQRMFQGFRRSVYLDVFAEDSMGVLYNIEIQQADEGADPRRTRFHTGMIDVHSLKAGQDFKELPEVYVIFITLNDTQPEIGYQTPELRHAVAERAYELADSLGAEEADMLRELADGWASATSRDVYGY